MIFLLREEEGQGLVEYGLLLILVAVALAVVLSMLGTTIANLFSQVTEAFNG
jgi:pilus assembly protein Flp/PilA